MKCTYNVFESVLWGHFTGVGGWVGGGGSCVNPASKKMTLPCAPLLNGCRPLKSAGGGGGGGDTAIS